MVCLPSPLGSHTRPRRGENVAQWEAVKALPYGSCAVSPEKINPAGAVGYTALCQPCWKRLQLNWLPRPYLSYEGTVGSQRTPKLMVIRGVAWKASCA